MAGNLGLELYYSEHYRAFLGFGQTEKIEEIRSGFQGDFCAGSAMRHRETQ